MGVCYDFNLLENTLQPITLADYPFVSSNALGRKLLHVPIQTKSGCLTCFGSCFRLSPSLSFRTVEQELMRSLLFTDVYLDLPSGVGGLCMLVCEEDGN